MKRTKGTRAIICHLNTNFLKNKFEKLTAKINGDKLSIDVVMIFKTKLDNSFPEEHFWIYRYGTRFRFDRNTLAGGIILYVMEYIPSKVIAIEKFIEAFFAEKNLRTKDWLLCASYKPKEINAHIASLNKILALY